MMTLFLIGLGVIAALIGITVWVDMPPIDEFGCRLKGEERDGRGSGAAVVGLVLRLRWKRC